MEDIPAYGRVTGDMRVERVWPVADGVAETVASGDRLYNFSLRFSGEECTCPARAKWRRQDVCKHLALVIHSGAGCRWSDPVSAVYAPSESMSCRAGR